MKAEANEASSYKFQNLIFYTFTSVRASLTSLSVITKASTPPPSLRALDKAIDPAQRTCIKGEV